MSENQVAAQYSSPIEAALSLKSELEAYDADQDRGPLLNALKEHFLLNRLVAASQAENTRDLVLQILYNRMEEMSDNTLLKALKVLSEAGEPDLTAIMGVPGGQTPMVTIQQAFGFSGGGSQSSLGGRTASNPVQDPGTSWRLWSAPGPICARLPPIY